MPPFTGAQRAEIRSYMGWPARFYQAEPALEMALNAVEQDPDTFDRVTGLLTSLEDIDLKISDALSRLKASKVGSITLPGQTEIGMLRSEGRRFVGRLAALLGVSTRGDAFGSYSQAGSNFVVSG